MYLSGSRARGNARRDSDIDLAFEHGTSPVAWADFVNAMREEAPTLLDLDLVDLAEVGPALRTRILSEGTMLLTSHTYNAGVADEILERLLTHYLPRFRAAQARVRGALSSQSP